MDDERSRRSFGTLPIAIGAGAGAELRQPLGVARWSAVSAGCRQLVDAVHHAGDLYFISTGSTRRLKAPASNRKPTRPRMSSGRTSIAAE